MAKPKKLNLKNETVILTKCKLFDKNNLYIGKGFTIQRQNGSLVVMLGLDTEDLHDKELEPTSEEFSSLCDDWFSIRHTDEQYLGVVCWVLQ